MKTPESHRLFQEVRPSRGSESAIRDVTGDSVITICGSDFPLDDADRPASVSTPYIMIPDDRSGRGWHRRRSRQGGAHPARSDVRWQRVSPCECNHEYKTTLSEGDASDADPFDDIPW